MALPPLTIAYLTFRARPLFGWFAASLAREVRSMPDYDPGDLQVLVIDGRHPRLSLELEIKAVTGLDFRHPVF